MEKYPIDWSSTQPSPMCRKLNPGNSSFNIARRSSLTSESHDAEPSFSLLQISALGSHISQHFQTTSFKRPQARYVRTGLPLEARAIRFASDISMYRVEE